MARFGDMITTVLLDWSGTLADDLAPVLEATNLVLNDLGVASLSRDEFRAKFRLPFEGFWKELTPQASMDQLEEAYHRHFVPIQHRVRLLPGAREFLEECTSHGLRTVLLSSIHPLHFERQSAGLGVREFFAEVCTGVRDKAQFLREWLQRREIEPQEAVFIGDMVHDIEAGRAAGVLTCTVLGGFDTDEKLLAAKPDFIVPSIAGAARVLRLVFAVNRLPVATVGALVRNADGRWLLVRTKKWSGTWGIPGGKIEPGERAEAALERELFEETGLRLRNIEFVMVQDAIRPVEFHRPAHFLLLNYTAVSDSSLVVLNDEAEEYVWVLPEQALRMRLNQPTARLIEHVLSRNE